MLCGLALPIFLTGLAEKSPKQNKAHPIDTGPVDEKGFTLSLGRGPVRVPVACIFS